MLSQVPRLSDTRYSASGNANAKFHNFSGISIDRKKNFKNCLKKWTVRKMWGERRDQCFWYTDKIWQGKQLNEVRVGVTKRYLAHR